MSDKKKKDKKNRKHTPYTSKAQKIAGNIARAAKEGKLPVSKLKGASKAMYKGMTKKELVSHSKEAKGKKLPEHVAGSEYVAERKEAKRRKARA